MKKRQSLSLICIGASTGGPRALQSVVPGLKTNLPAPILIVQHMPPKFTRSLAERLNQLTEMPVTEVTNGEKLKNSHIYVAAGGYHLLVRQAGEHLFAELSESPPVHGVRPSVDVTLKSLSASHSLSLVVAILTGMGRDGADGIVEVKQTHKQSTVIAESADSCVVYGMPKAAALTGKADIICPIGQIAAAISDQFE